MRQAPDGRNQQLGEGVEKRRLARAIRPEDRDERPRLDREVHLIERTVLLLRARIIAVREMLQLNPCHTFTFPFQSIAPLYRRLMVNTNSKTS